MSWLPDDFARPVRVPVPGNGIHLRPIKEADTAIDYPAVTIPPPGPARSSQSGMQIVYPGRNGACRSSNSVCGCLTERFRMA